MISPDPLGAGEYTAGGDVFNATGQFLVVVTPGICGHTLGLQQTQAGNAPPASEACDSISAR